MRPCTRYKIHVNSSWDRLVQDVSMTLTCSSYAQNIAASGVWRFITPSRHVVSPEFFDGHWSSSYLTLSISCSVFFSVRCRFTRSSSSSFSRGLFLRSVSLPTSRRLESYLLVTLPATTLLTLVVSSPRRCDLHCQNSLDLLRCWDSRHLLIFRRTGAWFAWRLVHQSCPVYDVQSPAVVVGLSLFLQVVLSFVRSECSCARIPFRIALLPGPPCVRSCSSKSDCFKCTLFDGRAPADDLGGILRPVRDYDHVVLT